MKALLEGKHTFALVRTLRNHDSTVWFHLASSLNMNIWWNRSMLLKPAEWPQAQYRPTTTVILLSVTSWPRIPQCVIALLVPVQL